MSSFFDGTLDDDLVISVASYGTPDDLLNLALTCRRLGSKLGAATRREWRALARDAKRQRRSLPCRDWSLVEEAARSAMEETLTKEERACLPPRDGESWMARYHELLLLRRPLSFDKLIGDGIVASGDNAQVWFQGSASSHCVLSNHIMRAGKHFASFTFKGDDGYAIIGDIMVGIFRPSKTILPSGGISSSNAMIGELNERGCIYQEVSYCLMSCHDGSGYMNYLGIDGDGGNPLRWQGREGFERNDVAGMLLDLDEGALTVYKNGRRLGQMKSGLAGEYCWGVYVGTYSPGKSVKICRGLIPE